jgi:hypothetical protein
VTLSKRDKVSHNVVLLHGHTIAVVNDNNVLVTSCRWRTATTKSRLNAVLRAFCGYQIYQYNYTWYVDDITQYDERSARPFVDGLSLPRRNVKWNGERWTVEN